MKVDRYKHKFEERSNVLMQAKAERALLEEQMITESQKVASKVAKKQQLAEVQALLVNTADQAREVGRQRLEKVVTRALQFVFGSDFSFKIEMTESGGKPSARFLVCSIGENGEEIENEPQESRGGGINDIVATALQVAVMVVYNEPKLQGPILLDEPGKHISEEYAVKFGEFLEFIRRTFNRQIIMVTHQPHLAATADKTIVSQLVAGKTVLKEQKDTDIDETDIDFEDETVESHV